MTFRWLWLWALLTVIPVPVFGRAVAAPAVALSSSAVAAAQPQAGAKTAAIHGIVLVPTGAPLAQVRVIVTSGGAGGEATTNVRGEYSLNNLAPGVYAVKISAPGYGPFEVQITLEAGADAEADAVLMALPKPAEPALGVAGEPAGETPGQTSAPGNAQTTVATQNFSVKPEPGKAALYGVLTDESGAVIASGSATAAASGAGPVTVTVNPQGRYVLNGLAPGQYHLKVSAQGFATFETDVALAGDQALEINATLQPSSQKTEVNVEAANAAEVKTSESHIEGTITEKEVLKTGLNGRNFTQLIALAPGVSNQTGQDEALVGVKGSVKYSVNGGRVEYNNFDVDGSDVLNAGLNGAESTLMVYPSLDAIQEVKVLTSNYGAMYGRSASGTVLVTTKSGMPKFHGGLYDFVRNEAFNARNYFDQTTKAPLYRRQDFGGTLGGPLFIPGVFNTRKDKTYFFWSEEFRLEKTPQEFNQAVPSAAERGIGVTCPNGKYSNGINSCADFSDVCPIAGTATVDQRLFPDCPIAEAGPAPFTNNLVPIDRTSATFLQSGMIPLPNSSTGCNSSLAGSPNISTGQPNIVCYDAVVSPSTYWREELARIDHNFTQGARLSFRYIHDSWDTTEATPVWGYVQNSFPTIQNRLVGPGTSLVVRLTNTLSPSLLNEFVVSYVNSHISLRQQPLSGVSLPVLPNCNAPLVGGGSAPCMGYIFNNGAGGKTPGLVISGTNAAYGGTGFAVDPSYAPWDHTSPTYALGDNVSKQLGKHTVQFGIQVLDAQRNETNGAIGAATGDLQGILTFSNQNNVTNGNAFADFLAGPNVPSCSQGCTSNAIKSYQQDSAQLKYYNNYWVAEPYVQDDWRVHQRFTVNLGLRVSIFSNYHEKNLNAWNWVAGNYNANAASANGVTLAPYSFPINGGYFANANFNCLKNGICTPIPFDPNNPSNPNPVLSQILANGLVQCGKNGVPASCMNNHMFNPAPRIGFAWDPKGNGKTSIRGGYGVFFEHGTAKESNTGSLEGSAPPVFTMTAPLPFSYANIGVCSGCSTSAAVAFPIDVTSIPTRTVWPYVQQWSFSVQRQLPKDTVATVAYVGSKGTHLSAELQINQLPAPPTGPDTGIFPTGNPFGPGQPLTVAGDCATFQNNSFVVNGISVGGMQPAYNNLAAACFGARDLINGAVLSGIPNPNLLRPYFGFQRILALRNIADSQYHAFQATLRRAHGPVTVGVSYTYSHSLDDSSDRSSASFVNSANIKSSWASSDFDQRHLLNFNYIYDLPKFARNFERWVSWRDADADDQGGANPAGGSKLFSTLLDGWQVSGITIFQSGTPFSVINGGSTDGISVLDNAGVANGAGSGSYPDIVGRAKSALPDGVNRFNSQSLGPLLYNPAAFAAPRGLTFGDAGRNYLNNPHRLNFDLSLLKNFKITEGSNLEFRAEAFNVFNHTQFRIFNSNIGNTANNTISCYGGGLGAPYTAAGGYTILPGTTNPQPAFVDCTSGSAFLHPIDAHRPRTMQLGLKYNF
ncbi:MAG TPA: carboxypeptidase regulatory-like domain-containing protein [Candidatus Dormibacteraeota bacterium]|nr:carboxypeptidase regulatory-like domain-containing protein [Candidatus Dormibacteraeota bacterium]